MTHLKLLSFFLSTTLELMLKVQCENSTSVLSNLPGIARNESGVTILVNTAAWSTGKFYSLVLGLPLKRSKVDEIKKKNCCSFNETTKRVSISANCFSNSSSFSHYGIE